MKIVQVVRYVEANNAVAGGTVVLTDEGSLYMAKWNTDGGPAVVWEKMSAPFLPDGAVALPFAAKPGGVEWDRRNGKRR